MARAPKPQEVRDACLVLEYLIHDLIAGHQLYDFFVSVGKSVPANPESEKAVRRMYVSYLLLALCKLSEFYTHYKWLIPDSQKSRSKVIEGELNRRGIRRLRNTFIGHILDKETGRPVTDVELNRAFNAAIDNDLGQFLKWVHVSGNVTSPDTVVGALEALHVELRRLSAE